DDAMNSQVFTTAPYAQKGTGWLKNAQDGIYTGGGDKLLLKPVQSGSGYTASFDIGLAQRRRSATMMPMNVAMWLQALRVIPRLSRDEWARLDLISRWLVAARGAVLVITFISCGVAGLLAIRDGGFDAGLWALATVALLFAHATNNLLNDW